MDAYDHRWLEQPEDEEEVDSRDVMCNVHGKYELSPLSWTVIDTPQFQRLREIKQLGVSYRVFPTASHNRFEHCIGVAHLARKLARRIRRKQPKLGITARDVQCVELAGLCHDLGHGPWSHVWDALFIPDVLPGSQWTHEEASEMMFDDLVTANEINISKADVDFIKDLIRGEPNHSGDKEKDKLFLFEIVANKRNGIDVDKLDYIFRDTRAVGSGLTYDIKSFIRGARVIDNEICYDIKQANNLFEMCYTRFSLHKRIYNHKTARAIEYMIIDALKMAEPTMKIAGQIRDPKRYLYLTDNIMHTILASQDKSLEKSRELFLRIEKRKLYRCVDFKACPWEYHDMLKEYLTKENIVAEAKRRYNPTEDSISPKIVESLNESHVIVDICAIHYGKKEHNPIDFISFYSKRKNKNVAFKANPGDSSTLLPEKFGEILVRIFTRDPLYLGIIQSGYNGMLERMNEELPSDLSVTWPGLSSMPLDKNALPDPEEPSTPVDEVPTQPNSRNVSFSSLIDGIPRTPSRPGGFAEGGSPPNSVRAGRTPFAKNVGMEVGKDYVYGVRTSPTKKGLHRPTGSDASSSMLTVINASSTVEEKGVRVSALAASAIISEPQAPADSLMRLPDEVEDPSSPSPSSKARRRHSPQPLKKSTPPPKAEEPRSSEKRPPRGGGKKRTKDDHGSDDDPKDGSPTAKRRKRRG